MSMTFYFISHEIFILFHIFQENDKNKKTFIFTAKYFLILLGRAGRPLRGRDVFNFERCESSPKSPFRSELPHACHPSNFRELLMGRDVQRSGRRDTVFNAAPLPCLLIRSHF